MSYFLASSKSQSILKGLCQNFFKYLLKLNQKNIDFQRETNCLGKIFIIETPTVLSSKRTEYTIGDAPKQLKKQVKKVNTEILLKNDDITSPARQ